MPFTWHLSRLMTKPTKWHVRPAKTQISLGIRPVWSESSLSAWRKIGSLATHWAHNEDSDQTGRMPRLIWVVAGRTCHFVGFVVRRIIYRQHPKGDDRYKPRINSIPGLSMYCFKCMYSCHENWINKKILFLFWQSSTMYTTLYIIEIHIHFIKEHITLS